MKPDKILEETELAVGGRDMVATHEILNKLGKEMRQVQVECGCRVVVYESCGY